MLPGSSSGCCSSLLHPPVIDATMPCLFLIPRPGDAIFIIAEQPEGSHLGVGFTIVINGPLVTLSHFLLDESLNIVVFITYSVPVLIHHNSTPIIKHHQTCSSLGWSIAYLVAQQCWPNDGRRLDFAPTNMHRHYFSLLQVVNLLLVDTSFVHVWHWAMTGSMLVTVGCII